MPPAALATSPAPTGTPQRPIIVVPPPSPASTSVGTSAGPGHIVDAYPMRTTETEITFTRPFRLESLVEPQEAGTYRLITDEELIEGLSFPAYRRVAMHLEIPSISALTVKRQRLQVSYEDIYRALALDAEPPGAGEPQQGHWSPTPT